MSCLYIIIYTYLSLLRYILAFNPFDDSQLYDISWAGPSVLRHDNIDEHIFITTKDNEQYQCVLPRIHKNIEANEEHGPSLSALELLKSLTDNAQCSYRLEVYWTYEICHGAHIRQYHDQKPRDDKPMQEYILGKITTVNNERVTENIVKETKEDEEVPKRTFRGRSIPYYEVIMDNGTPCELLGGKPRVSHVIYMCKPDSRNEVVSVKEIQSCVYQIEILTPLLCASDMYNAKEDVVHQINCHSLDGSPREPHSYHEYLEESTTDMLGTREYQYMPVQGESPEEDIRNDEHRKIPPQPDQQLTNDFLKGDYCLRGGSGWWHYEYCHSKHVIQYHEDKQGKTIIYLGTWNKDVHVDWVQKHPKRKTDYVTHYYSNGDLCDITGKARTVQVRLRCLKSEQLQAVSIFLLEPKPCQYVLGVDSPILCPLVENADEFWIFPITP